MKRTLIIVALVLVISTSIIAGTLAMYTITIDDFAEGSVVAKEFILEEGTQTFAKNVKIAPGETEEWQFSVKNYEGEGEDAIVSETAMDLEFTVDIAGTDEDNAIAPLKITVKDGEGDNIPLDSNKKFSDEFPLKSTGQEKTYTVVVKWPWETEGVDDIDYAGEGYGSAVKVSVTGIQK